eukprot:CAMPEP_0201128616 /NCGR_PEP_ID=MMETSP0850-20130426/34297_1 /ASSEMBLY_ACC=CAM_ASM_000622 /TAXON_ID=183588 /ORGANISM="Pseudo-nitzschia fraudulenta, Strain WWA7" /LENGTH=157 /DNA_ID=CAMNT_0047397855 /DNA_START=28 /DNA_END=501 /DNA_ORIENTATION=+
MTDKTIKGKCNCGKVTFELTGAPMMNALCHCNACTSGLGSSCAVHLWVAASSENYKITSGEELLKRYDGNKTLKFWKCSGCGSPIYQGPEAAPFRGFYPRTFDGYVDGKCNKLPDDLQPTMHVNYENRLWDANDDKPKFAAFPPEGMVNNDGSPITA